MSQSIGDFSRFSEKDNYTARTSFFLGQWNMDKEGKKKNITSDLPSQGFLLCFQGRKRVSTASIRSTWP